MRVFAGKLSMLQRPTAGWFIYRGEFSPFVGPLDTAAAVQNTKVQPKDQWEREQAADQDDGVEAQA
jgi:hypothetical protein